MQRLFHSNFLRSQIVQLLTYILLNLVTCSIRSCSATGSVQFPICMSFHYVLFQLCGWSPWDLARDAPAFEFRVIGNLGVGIFRTLRAVRRKSQNCCISEVFFKALVVLGLLSGVIFSSWEHPGNSNMWYSYSELRSMWYHMRL